MGRSLQEISGLIAFHLSRTTKEIPDASILTVQVPASGATVLSGQTSDESSGAYVAPPLLLKQFSPSLARVRP